MTAISPSVGEEKDPGMLLLIISFLIFGCLIFIGGWMPTRNNKFRFNLRHGQIRSAIAGTLVFGFVILTFFSLYYPLNEGTIFNQFSQVVGIIIGFYLRYTSDIEALPAHYLLMLCITITAGFYLGAGNST